MNALRRTIGRRAFSLIEVVLYVALATIMITTLLRITLAVLDVRSQVQASGSVEQELDAALLRMTVALRDAQGVDVLHSKFGTALGKLSLTMSGTTVNPTVFALSGSSLTIKEGTGKSFAMTGSGVSVDRFQVTNLTPPNAHTVIQLQLHALSSFINANGKPAEDETLQTSVMLRQ